MEDIGARLHEAHQSYQRRAHLLSFKLGYIIQHGHRLANSRPDKPKMASRLQAALTALTSSFCLLRASLRAVLFRSITPHLEHDVHQDPPPDTNSAHAQSLSLMLHITQVEDRIGIAELLRQKIALCQQLIAICKDDQEEESHLQTQIQETQHQLQEYLTPAINLDFLDRLPPSHGKQLFARYDIREPRLWLYLETEEDRLWVERFAACCSRIDPLNLERLFQQWDWEGAPTPPQRFATLERIGCLRHIDEWEHVELHHCEALATIDLSSIKHWSRFRPEVLNRLLQMHHYPRTKVLPLIPSSDIGYFHKHLGSPLFTTLGNGTYQHLLLLRDHMELSARSSYTQLQLIKHHLLLLMEASTEVCRRQPTLASRQSLLLTALRIGSTLTISNPRPEVAAQLSQLLDEVRFLTRITRSTTLKPLGRLFRLVIERWDIHQEPDRHESPLTWDEVASSIDLPDDERISEEDFVFWMSEYLCSGVAVLDAEVISRNQACFERVVAHLLDRLLAVLSDASSFSEGLYVALHLLRAVELIVRLRHPCLVQQVVLFAKHLQDAMSAPDYDLLLRNLVLCGCRSVGVLLAQTPHQLLTVLNLPFEPVGVDLTINLRLRQSDLVQASFEYVLFNPDTVLHEEAMLVGDDSIDAGGPRRAWLDMMLAIVQETLIEESSPTARTPSHFKLGCDDRVGRFVGVIMGKAFQLKMHLPFALPMDFFQILGEPLDEARVQRYFDELYGAQLHEFLNIYLQHGYGEEHYNVYCKYLHLKPLDFSLITVPGESLELVPDYDESQPLVQCPYSYETIETIYYARVRGRLFDAFHGFMRALQEQLSKVFHLSLLSLVPDKRVFEKLCQKKALTAQNLAKSIVLLHNPEIPSFFPPHTIPASVFIAQFLQVSGESLLRELVAAWAGSSAIRLDLVPLLLDFNDPPADDSTISGHGQDLLRDREVPAELRRVYVDMVVLQGAYLGVALADSAAQPRFFHRAQAITCAPQLNLVTQPAELLLQSLYQLLCAPLRDFYDDKASGPSVQEQ